MIFVTIQKRLSDKSPLVMLPMLDQFSLRASPGYVVVVIMMFKQWPPSLQPLNQFLKLLHKDLLVRAICAVNGDL